MEEKFGIQRMRIIGLNKISMYREENIVNSNLAEIGMMNYDNLLILLKVRYIVYDVGRNCF